jgi:hypothetical protein
MIEAPPLARADKLVLIIDLFGSEGLTGAEKYGFPRHKAVVPAFIG